VPGPGSDTRRPAGSAPMRYLITCRWDGRGFGFPSS